VPFGAGKSRYPWRDGELFPRNPSVVGSKEAIRTTAAGSHPAVTITGETNAAKTI